MKFARETDVLCNEWLIEWLKAEQEKPLNEVKTRVQIWEDYLSRMSKDGQWADEVQGISSPGRLGCVDLDLESSPGWWAGTVATS